MSQYKKKNIIKEKLEVLGLKLATDVEVRLVVKGRLKCLYESFRPPKKIDNCGLPPIISLFKKKKKKEYHKFLNVIIPPFLAFYSVDIRTENKRRDPSLPFHFDL